MGLILTKYVQDLALLKQDTWEGNAVVFLPLEVQSAVVQLQAAFRRFCCHLRIQTCRCLVE